MRRREIMVKCRRRLAGKCGLGPSHCAHAKYHDPMMMPDGKLCTEPGLCPAWNKMIRCHLLKE